MAKCAGCGNDLPIDAIFCPQCATRVVAQATGPGIVIGSSSMATEQPGVAPRTEPVSAPLRAPAPAAAAIAGTPLATLSGMQTITGPVQRGEAQLAEGDVFHGRYTIERHLGAGAMGVVYAARDQVTGRTVALKLINPALADRPTARERFIREGLMARDVRHSNIVAMYDVGEAQGQVYLVMEYLGGETLRKWLRRMLQEGRDIPFDAARGIIRAVLEGLVAAHATGVVHRDLKPENVMLTGDPDKGDYSLKVLDFGIARAVGASVHVTTTSSSTGTPLYMAPEQKTAADTVGPPADLYAVTAMLYELLIGVAPEGRWGPPSRERKDLPHGIDAVIETGLASRPRSRYQTAGEYIEALDAVGAPGSGARQLVAPLPPQPPPPEKESGASWLKARSPAWALWDRMSRSQRRFVAMAGLLAVCGVAGYYIVQGTNGGGGGGGVVIADPPLPPPEDPVKPPEKTPEKEQQKPPEKEPEPPPPPPPPPDMNIAGRWADALTGTVTVASYVDVYQQGNQVSGPIYDPFGNQAGTFSGRVSGNDLEYRYVAANGWTGAGRGRLTADGNHLEIDVRNDQTGITERHTMHRGHLPHQ